LGIGYPEAYGGSAGDTFVKIAATEELMRCGSGGVAAGLGSLDIGIPPVLALGTEEQKSRFIPPVLRGEKIAALGITEPNAGSDVANIQTKAVRKDDHYVVNGSKMFITSGARADQLTCAVRTGGEGYGGVSLLVMESDTPGYSVSEKLKKIAKEHGPECVALFSHGSGGKYFSQLLKAYGSTNVTAPSFAQCRGPREVAFAATFGEIIGSPERTDIRDTNCLVLIGSHLGENMHNGQVQEFSDVIEKGATVITVDPRYSTAASKSKYWLPIKPSTDLALLLTWINIIN